MLSTWKIFTKKCGKVGEIYFKFFPCTLFDKVGFRSYDLFIPLSVFCILSGLIFPLPTFFLDFGLSFSIVLSVIVLMVSLFVDVAVEFSSFPVLLLLTTLLRLSLEIATTRLILGQGYKGPLAAGHIVSAFGGFLMNGDVAIGIILFVILMVVNFMVITKGSGRIAEVAARFSLDAMPGKQMAIDAELNSGAINDKDAKQRRRDLEEESSFYGTMDGAAKFVRGDAIAAIIIAFVNMVAGLGLGVFRFNMTINDAFSTFAILTVGDGLVTQIPALLVSTAAGIIVTKGASEGKAGDAVAQQLGKRVSPLAIASAVSLILSFLPGLPTFAFLGLFVCIGTVALVRGRNNRALQISSLPEDKQHYESSPVETQVVLVEPLKLELGLGLLPLVSDEGTRLTSQIQILRRKIADDFGFILPSVRVQDNMNLPHNTYSIKVRDIEAGKGSVELTKLLVMDPKGGMPDILGDTTVEAVFGLEARWILPERREDALFRGYTVVDPASVIATHLSEIVKDNLPELLSLAEVEKMMAGLPDDIRKNVAEFVPTQLPIAILHRVFQSLLAEYVSIRDASLILEAMQEAIAMGQKTTSLLLAHVRLRLARQISHSVLSVDGTIPAVILGARWEGEFMTNGAEGTLPSSLMNEFIEALRQGFEFALQRGEFPVVLVDSMLRTSVRAIVERIRPSVSVIAYSEIFPRVKIKTVATLS
ncbi:flagellar biosynthesis protein FlhA [Acidomonas methanolica]|uniref:flagellar biosynthesis protein FlhA n=2 Tax=Acidomonas methanolica TaxID=437 RepID=UPI0009DE8081|nr:flagellar biosynthesis protein FlhA [Acidomonas methanolica]MBU2655682.1 flagellar biosynthesis protein FlhA [Acidomonas methanolica]TCS21151.1 flagellar biosynthesis protein FlhA [Acidomonas methanolica]